MTTDVRVTDHARLRYRQRVDPGEPYLTTRIRELFAKGREVNAVERGNARYINGLLLVYHGSDQPTITTILRDIRTGPNRGSS